MKRRNSETVGNCSHCGSTNLKELLFTPNGIRTKCLYCEEIFVNDENMDIELKQRESEYTDVELIKVPEVKQEESKYTKEYADCRYIDGKPRWIIVDKTGNIIDDNPGKSCELKSMKIFHAKTVNDI